jgi:hypothetical protein
MYAPGNAPDGGQGGLGDARLGEAHPVPDRPAVLVQLQHVDLVGRLGEVHRHTAEHTVADVLHRRRGLLGVGDQPPVGAPRPDPRPERLPGLPVDLLAGVEPLGVVDAAVDDRRVVALPAAVGVAPHRHERLRQIPAPDRPRLPVATV